MPVLPVQRAFGLDYPRRVMHIAPGRIESLSLRRELRFQPSFR
jgi:hypothetical protein